MLEHEFILKCTQGLEEADLKPFPPESLEGLNWPYILEKAKIHGVAPLIYNSIKKLPSQISNSHIPAEILEQLEKIYTYTAFHNMIYLDELQKITKDVENCDIKMIVLKGPMLAKNVYNNIALRPFIDIDILIKNTDLDKMEAILGSMGYASENKDFYKNYHFHLPFIKIGKIPIQIELHWSFVDNFILQKIDMDTIWKETNDYELPHKTNLLYLLLHIEKHAFLNKVIYDKENPRDWIFTNPLGNQLLWYMDIYKLINKYNIVCKDLLDLADKWCIKDLLLHNLFILNKLYPIPLLDSLPEPNRLSWSKRMIYSIFLKNKPNFSLQEDAQLRPIRVLDLINYIFPSPSVIKKYYCPKYRFPVIILYPLHLLFCLKEITKELYGICKLKLSTKRRKAFPAAN